MTTIGYATLQIIPSLKGVSEAIDKQLSGVSGIGTSAGRKLGGNIADGVRGSEAQISAALSQAVNRRGGEKVGKDWADSTASAMAQHLQSAQNSTKLQSSLAYLVKNGDQAGKQFARDMAANLAIELPNQARGRQIGEKVGKVIGVGIASAAGAGVAAIGYTLTKGFQRLESIDQATFKLKALGHSADETKTIMDNATASVKGTAFSLADAATAAASAVAAGIKPGQDLTKYLGEVGDAAAIANTGFDEMGHIFNKIQTQNKAYTDDLQMLSDRGVPIFQWLQQEYGVTGEALTKMVEKGQVDAEHFQAAISDNIGGSAQKMGQSFQGAVDNAETAVARLGAHFLGSIFGDKDGNQLAGPTEAITKLTEKFDQIDAWVQAHGPQIHQFFATMVTDAQAVGKPLGEIAGFLAQHPQLIAAVAAAFAAWKTGQAIAGIADVVGRIRGMGTDLDEMPGKASASASGISRALALIVVPEIGKELNDQLNNWLAQNHPLLNDINQSHTPDQLGKSAADAIQRNLSPHPQGPSGPATIGPNNQVVVIPPPPPGKNPLDVIAGKATGGAIFGAGTATSDSIPALLSNGEHVLTAKEVQAMGGQAGVYAFRNMLHRSGGGSILPMAQIPWPPGKINKTGDRAGNVPNLDSGSSPSQRALPWLINPDAPIPRGLPGVPLPPTDDDILFPENQPWWMRKWLEDHPPSSWKNPHRNMFLGAGLGFAGGGAVGGMTADQVKKFAAGISGHAYVWGGGNGDTFATDCSGAQSTVANYITGGKGRFTTATEAGALQSRGFKIGDPPPGISAYWVGWRNGGPGAGHTAGTIVDPSGGNTNVEMGGAGGNGQFGGSASGASSFPNRAWVPLSAGDDPSRSNFAGASASAAVTGGGGDLGGFAKSGGGAADAGGGGGGSSISVSSSLSGFGSSIGQQLGALGSNLGGGKLGDLGKLGSAAGSLIDGQIGSALDVFGVPSSPGWLKGISTLIGGISIGGGGGSSAPLAASPNLGGFAKSGGDPGNMHGLGAGQAPGPTYNITARDTEDAFVKAQRVEREKAAAKLSRF